MLINTKKVSPFDWALIGLLLYEFIIIFDKNSVVTILLSGLGISITLLNLIFRIKHRIPFYGYKRALFFLYLFWSLFIVLRSILTTGANGFSLVNQYGVASLITPLIVFAGYSNSNLKSVFKFSYIYGIIGIIITIMNFNLIFKSNIDFSGEEYGSYVRMIEMSYFFLFSTAFMFLSYALILPKYKKIASIAMIICTFVVLFGARRGALFMNLLFFLFAFHLFVFSSKKGSKFFKLAFVLAIITVGVVTFLMYADSAFSFLFSRLDEDSRAPLEVAFYDSFEGETLDWIFGRGINGTYYCILFDDSFLNYRGLIETGYLHIILKGGLVSLVIYVFFLLNSAYVGFFKTNNRLTKAMAFYLLAHVIYLIPFGLPAFSLEYAIVWLCVLYCQSKKWRAMSDVEIKIFLGVLPIINRKLNR